MNSWDRYERLLDAMGAESLCDALARAMSSDELDELCEFIARDYEIEFE